MLEKVNKLVEKVNDFTPNSKEDLNNFRIEYLGKKGVLNDLFNLFREVPNNQKKEFGVAINNLKSLVQTKIDQHKDGFENKEEEELIDLSRPVDLNGLGRIALHFELITFRPSNSEISLSCELLSVG